jgi:membrane-anchored glycerophosphoryl diester phosphodiesterase (GDPDase)
MIAVIVVFILMAIICIAVFYWFGFCIGRKSEDSRDQLQIKKELFRKKLSKQKELCRQIRLK